MNPARFEVRDGASDIAFFDDLLQPAALFVGPVDAPRHLALFVTLHEIGHAIDSAHIRIALARFNAEVMSFNAQGGTKEEGERLEAKRRALQSEESVSAGFRERFGSITKYGATSDSEAFAEAYALFRVDPAALRRVSPEGARWFASGGHLEALRLLLTP